MRMVCMEPIEIRGKENIINAYGVKPILPYDIEGVLIQKEGKNVKVETNVGAKTVIYSLKLKEEIEEKVGDDVHIEKENIASSRISKEEEPAKKEDVRSLEALLQKLGIEINSETLKIAECLCKNNIPVTEENIDSFMMAKDYLDEIIRNIDYDSAIQLMKKDINIGEESLQKISQSIKEVKNNDGDKSLLRLLGFKKDISYSDAEKIATKIYGRRMGKDIYDAIIALHKEGLEVNKENIENVKEVLSKLHDLKDIDNDTFLKLLKNELEATIENLYRLKNSYSTETIESNVVSNIYETFTIEKEISGKDIARILEELGLENTARNTSLIREFILNGVDINKENVDKINGFKENLYELIDVMDEENTSRLLKSGVDPLKENIDDLLYKIKQEEPMKDISSDNIAAKEILQKIKTIGEVEDGELVLLLKSGEDFSIGNLKKISSSSVSFSGEDSRKVVDKVMNISNMFNTLNELDSQTIAYAGKRASAISLGTLYESKVNHEETTQYDVQPIEKEYEDFIRREYLKVKESLSLRIVKESVGEGLDVEWMPLGELNDYIDKKINRSREVEKALKDIRCLEGKSYDILPLAMRNGLDISLSELQKLNRFYENRNGLGEILNDLVKQGKSIQNEEVENEVRKLEEKSKDVSDSLKKGDGKAKGYYKELIKGFADLSNSFNSERGSRFNDILKRAKDSMRIQNALSKEDLVFQLPILMGDTFKNLQVIIPNLNKGIDKNSMTFLISINTSKLGNLKFSLDVKGKDISMEFVADEKSASHISENRSLLEDGLNNIGYNLIGLSIKMDNWEEKDYSLKTIDAKV
mgnify:FL=1